jgi:phosphatidylglycerol:prolipoprotein diacylglycerol transferase
MRHDFDTAIAITPFGAIYWYGAVYSLGFLGVFLWFWIGRKSRGLSNAEVFSLTIAVSVGVLIGGRVFDILVYELDYYREHPAAVLNWWEGGMASHGVLLGILASIYLFARTHGKLFLTILDEIAIPGIFLLALGRLGNFIEGGVVGTVTELPWGFVYDDLEGMRHPVALYESAKNFLILPILIWALQIWPAGRGVVLSLFILLYAGLRFMVDLFRDYEAAWLGLGTGQVFNLIMATTGLLMLVWFLRNPRANPGAAKPQDERVGLVRPILLALLIVYPLGIPTSWTAKNIAAKRQETQEEAALPIIVSVPTARPPLPLRPTDVA